MHGDHVDDLNQRETALTTNDPIDRRRRYRRFVVALAVLLVLLTWYRGLWWPVPFQAAARKALAKHDNDAALNWLGWATWLVPEDGETAFLRARALRRNGNIIQSAD